MLLLETIAPFISNKKGACKKVKVKAVRGSYSTDAFRHIVLLPE